MKKLSNAKGVNLSELLVVLVIISILALAAFPLFNSLLQKHRVSGQAESLYQALQYARIEAIKQNVSVTVSFVAGDTWCYGINTSTACNCLLPSTCNLGATAASAPQQTTLSTTGLSSAAITFEPVHGSANSSGVVTLTLYGASNLISINISKLGQLKMCATNISGYPAC